MKVCRYVVYIMAMAALSACSHAEKEVNFTEEELSPPMEEQVEHVQNPGSLWSPNAKYSDMFCDHRARRVGDLIIIQIVESSSADKEATTEASRDSSTDNSVTSFLGLPLDKSSVFGYKINPSVQTDSSSTFNGDGKTTRKGTLSAVVSARIMRILPSGNFAVKGKKQIRVNDEEQYITVSGIVRPEDIMGNNAVLSANVADLKVDYYGAGVIGDQQNKGFLARAIDKIWPF